MGSALQLFGTIHAIDDYSVDLEAVTAKEGPQVRLTASGVSIGTLQARIVARERHSPRVVTDGRTVWQGALDPDGQTVVYDVLCEPKTWAYYKLFILLDGRWQEPENNTASAFTGATPKLERTGLETTLATVFQPSDKSPAFLVGSYLASNAKWASVTSTAGWTAGDWCEIGGILRHVTAVEEEAITYIYNDTGLPVPYGEMPEEGRETISYTTYRLHFARLGVVPDDKTVTPVENEQLTFVSINAALDDMPTVSRTEGTWAENGFQSGMCVRVQGTGLFDGIYLAVALYGKLMTLGCRRDFYAPTPDVSTGVVHPFAPGDLVTTAARVLGPPGICSGTPVYQLRQVNSDVGAFLYDEAVPDAIPIGDEIEDQGVVLEPTVDADGELVNLGAPGRQLGAQRYIRTLAQPLANAKAAIESLEGIADVWTAPVQFLRQAIENYNTGVGDHETDVEVRNLTALQPDLITMRGRLDILKIWLENITGEACVYQFGRDKIARFDEVDPVISGFGWDGWVWTEGLTYSAGHTDFELRDTETGSSLSWTDSSDEPAWLVGMSLRVDGDDYEITDLIAPSTVRVAGDATAEGDDYYQIVETRGQRYATQPSICTTDPDSVFNDKGLLIYLKSGINLAQKAKIEALCRDWKPISESWLVYSGETLLLDLSE